METRKISSLITAGKKAQCTTCYYVTTLCPLLVTRGLPGKKIEIMNYATAQFQPRHTKIQICTNTIKQASRRMSPQFPVSATAQDWRCIYRSRSHRTVNCAKLCCTRAEEVASVEFSSAKNMYRKTGSCGGTKNVAEKKDDIAVCKGVIA